MKKTNFEKLVDSEIQRVFEADQVQDVFKHLNENPSPAIDLGLSDSNVFKTKKVVGSLSCKGYEEKD